MPTKQLTIDIPEPDGNRCDITCPMHQCDSDNGTFCAAGVDIWVGHGTCCRSNIKPGPKCPQFQGDKP